jgi:hypothetical protein
MVKVAVHVAILASIIGIKFCAAFQLLHQDRPQGSTVTLGV